MEKGFVFFLIITAFVNTLFAQTPSTTIAFEERVYNFGTVREKNGKVSHTFILKNNGKTPAVIDEVYSGCGCIGRTLSNAPIKPGDKGKVTITFDPGYKSGFFSKEIVVFTKNRQEYNRIWVEGNITPFEHPVQEEYPYNFGNGLYLRLKVMAFGYLKPGEVKEVELAYANNTSKEMLLNFVVANNKTGLKFTNPGKIAPKAKGVMIVSYTMPAVANDEILFKLYPVVNNTKLTQTLEVKILNANTLNQKTIPKQKN